jgi:hypothetical protein
VAALSRRDPGMEAPRQAVKVKQCPFQEDWLGLMHTISEASMVMEFNFQLYILFSAAPG